MRLRNPGGIEDALNTIKQVRSELSNASNAHGAAGRKDAFLSWCNGWASPQLGNHIPPSEDVFAQLGESHNRVVLAPPMSDRQLNGFINRECSEWLAALDRMSEELKGRMAFAARAGHLVVLDTSALMEGAFFTEFDWHALDATLKVGAVRLVLPSLVVEELDDLKRQRDWRAKERARRVLRTLWNLHRASPAEPAGLPGRPDVTIEVLLDGDWHQRRPNNDGEIIDQAVVVREMTGQPVILAAGDYTQLYRAAQTGLAAVLMPRPDES